MTLVADPKNEYVRKIKDYGNGKYDGTFYNYEMHGRGTYYFANGDIYTGDYVFGKRTGIFLYNPSIRHGQGTYYKNNGDKYIGEWEKDLRNGHGIYVWNKGGYYEGGFLSNERHGQGTIYRVDGTIEKGTWNQGRKVE